MSGMEKWRYLVVSSQEDFVIWFKVLRVALISDTFAFKYNNQHKSHGQTLNVGISADLGC